MNTSITVLPTFEALSNYNRHRVEHVYGTAKGQGAFLLIDSNTFEWPYDLSKIPLLSTFNLTMAFGMEMITTQHETPLPYPSLLTPPLLPLPQPPLPTSPPSERRVTDVHKTSPASERARPEETSTIEFEVSPALESFLSSFDHLVSCHQQHFHLQSFHTVN